MKDLIFIGGAKGVGKSTLVEKLRTYFSINVINTGEFFIQARENGLNYDQEISEYLKNKHRGLVDTHYAGYQGNGFVRGISREGLLAIKSLKTIELVLIDLDLQTLLKRREKDKRIGRELDAVHAQIELGMNRLYFDEYSKDLLTPGVIIKNINLDEAFSSLLKALK